ncbi:MAG: ABC transporter ATP-binding protein [Thermodesulfovibrionales bacterium]|jgi:putative ABC transport system ATP-binding protein
MIELVDVRKIFNKGRPNEFTALAGVSLAIEPGRITVLKGPSGSGKTTLLSIIGCMTRPSSGRVSLAATGIPWTKEARLDITSLPERFLTFIRRQTFGFIFQQFHLIKGISVLENVMLPACPTGEAYKPLRERAVSLLDTFNLSSKASSRVEWLSGGEAQRVAIARALINNPSVIIADEPTAHLDSRLSLEFMDIMGSLRDRGKTIIMASHDPVVHDSSLADRVVEMRDGRRVGERE